MAISSVMKPVLPVAHAQATWNLKSLFLSPRPAFHHLQYVRQKAGGSMCTRLLIQYSCIVNQNPVCSWYLWWKVFQCRKEQSLLTFETCQCYKASNLVLLQESDTYPVSHWQKSALVSFTVSSFHRILLRNTKDELLKELWRDFVIENGQFPELVRQKLIFSLQRISGFPCSEM